MDKTYIKNVVQSVLNKQFTVAGKRKINDFHDRINFACPYCGDSKSAYKKRGNIWWNKLLFVCFNCDKKTSFDRMCKDFNEQIDPEHKLAIIEHLNNNITYDDYQDDFVDAKFDDLIDLPVLENIFNTKNVAPITNFEPVRVGGGIYKYLIGRGIPPQYHQNIYQARYWKNEDQFDHIICFLNRRGNKILGLQIRNLKEGKRRYFKIYNYENLHRWVHGEDSDLDLTKAVIYNKLSYFFNVLNVDFNHVVTVFEGYIDSLFYPNSIGIVGVNTDTKFLENNNLEIQYFFDNDEAGFKKTDQKLREGFRTFLWKKLFENIISSKKTDDSYKLEYRINKVKDLNKLAQLVENPYQKMELDKYFSQDLMDLKYIPKYKRKWKNGTDDRNYDQEFKNLNW